VSDRHAALAPEALELVRAHEASGRPPIYESDLSEARRAVSAAAAPLEDREPVAHTHDATVEGPGGPIPVRVYRPGDGVLPTLLYFHGGCWIVGDLDSHDTDCRSLANRAGCQVISVDYRLAPEHPFPAAIDDGYAVLAEVAGHPETWATDPQLLAVGGVSSGGNVAAAVAVMARDRGGPALAFQLLVYPVMDPSLDTSSYAQYGERHILTTETMRWSWEQYVPDPAERFHPYAAPLRATELRGLPPALVITAACDPLRDEAEAYGRRLEEDGVPAVVSRYPGMVHMFFSLPTVLPTAARAHDEAAAHLRRAFDPARPR
jgi:acetyl esterase